MTATGAGYGQVEEQGECPGRAASWSAEHGRNAEEKRRDTGDRCDGGTHDVAESAELPGAGSQNQHLTSTKDSAPRLHNPA